jgi:hypothetical protein
VIIIEISHAELHFDRDIEPRTALVLDHDKGRTVLALVDLPNGSGKAFVALDAASRGALADLVKG